MVSSSRDYSNWLFRVTALVTLVLSPLLLASLSGGSRFPTHAETLNNKKEQLIGSRLPSYTDKCDDNSLIKNKEQMIGSQPPSCHDKCETCNPCEPAMKVIHRQLMSRPHEEKYYAVMWKCKCGGKYYDP